MLTKIDHIGIAVNSLEEATKYYEEVLGLKCEGTEEVLTQKVKTAFFTVGDVHIELLEPIGTDGPISKFLEKNGQGVHHIAFASSDITKDLHNAKEHNVRLINEVPVDGAHGKEIAFLHPKSTFGVLTEFCFKR